MDTNFPLLISFNGSYFGRGFVAEITAFGRILASRSDEGVWLYGVNPGAIAQSGATLEDAHNELREALRESIAILANEAASFQEFHASVKSFFLSTNKETAEEWNEALTRVRTAKDRLDDLPVRKVDEPWVLIVEKLLQDVTPANNDTKVEASLAKAA